MIFIRAMTSPDEASRRRALLQRFRRLRFMLTDAWCPSPYHHLKYREKRKREKKENTHPTTQRTCLETAPPSIPSLPLHTCTNSLDPFLCLSGCLPFAPCPNIWPFCWQIKLHSFFLRKHGKRAIFDVTSCLFLSLFSVITLFMSVAINCCQLLLMY